MTQRIVLFLCLLSPASWAATAPQKIGPVRKARAVVSEAWRKSVDKHPVVTSAMFGAATGLSAFTTSSAMGASPHHAFMLGTFVAAKAPVQIFGGKYIVRSIKAGVAKSKSVFRNLTNRADRTGAPTIAAPLP